MTIEQLKELERLAEKADPPTVKTLIRALRMLANQCSELYMEKVANENFWPHKGDIANKANELLQQALQEAEEVMGKGFFDCFLETKPTNENEPYYIGYSYGYDYKHGVAGTDAGAIVLAQNMVEARDMMAEKLEKRHGPDNFSIHTNIQIGRSKKWIFEWGSNLTQGDTK